MFKLNIHSIVDVITNSSTVIYTYQDSTKEAKELLQEILNLIGEKKEVDDLFYIGVFLEDGDYYTDYLSEEVDEEEYPEGYPKDDWKARNRYIADLQEMILKGEVDKPEWMKRVEERTNYNGYEYSTSLYILPKDEKYSELTKRMIAFLNFPSHESSYDG